MNNVNTELQDAIYIIANRSQFTTMKNRTRTIITEPYPKIGNVIQFGNLDWRVLDKKDGKLLVISNKTIEKRPYHGPGRGIAWETCAIRHYLNNIFYKNVFTADEQNLIQDTYIINTNNNRYDTNAGKNTIDKLFLLSTDEAKQYFDVKPLNIHPDYLNRKQWLRALYHSKKVKNREENRWWLRSPGYKTDYAAYTIALNPNESYTDTFGNGVISEFGIRPAMWIAA